MQSSAASLSDKLIVSLANHRVFKTWILTDSQTVDFEGSELFFEKRDKWHLIVDHQTIECIPESTIFLQISSLHRVEISFSVLNDSYLNPGLLVLEDKLVIGSDYVNDGITEAQFHEKEVTLIREKDNVRYKVQGDGVCAVNGKIVEKEGMISVPSLLESGLLKVFVADSCVVFNHCILTNLQHDQLVVKSIEPMYYKRIKDHFIAQYENLCLSKKMPEFPLLPEVHNISLSTIGPMLTMSLASLLTAWISYQTSGNEVSLIMPSVMIFSAVFWPFTGFFIAKIKQNCLKRKRRHQYLEECEELLQQIQDFNLKVRHSIQHPEKLDVSEYWQIRPNHSRFLHLPLGYGKLENIIELKQASNQPSLNETVCLNKMNEIMKTASNVDNTLIECDLLKDKHIALISSSHFIEDISLRIIMMMGCMHDLKSVHYVLISDNESLNWKLRSTPLFQNGSECNVFDQSVSFSECEKRLSDFASGNVVCFVLNRTKFEQVNSRIRQKCLSVYFLGHHELIPSECTKIFRISSEGFIQPGKVMFTINDYEAAMKLFNNLHYFQPPSSFKRTYGQIDFLSLFPVLNEEKILENWKNGGDPVGILGVNQYDELIELNLSEHHEGPHGLIAGMTGSGKSVLLLGFLLSLAIRCSPLDLQMLVIDYKGGTLFQQLQSKKCVLPHLCGWLSNQSSFIGRTLSSISYECSRRQKLFEKASKVIGRTIADIHDYRVAQKSNHQIPHLANLLIIVDEFAELKREEPEFLKTLISLSRTGRSLGLHLILCTQKISGVVDDEITGNARFRIGLRVSRASESRELLGCENAVHLKRPGEFVMVSDQRTVTGQSSYCLAPIYDYPKIVSLTNSCGTVIKTSRELDSSSARQNEKIVELLKKTAELACINVSPLWLPPLKKKNALNLLQSKQILIGMVDFPDIRSQKTMLLHHEHHLLLGYQTEAQRIELIEYYLKQLLYLGDYPVYYVQLISKIRSPEQCIQPDRDQMERFLKCMSSVQNERSIILIDDLVEFMEYFESISQLNSFLFKAVQRKIQCICLLRSPFSVSGLLLDQFATKVIFGDINDSESMNLFHVRRENNRIASLSQGYTLIHEKLCVLQLEALPDSIKECAELKTIKYLPEIVSRPKSETFFVGVSMKTLEHVQLENDSSLILTGMNIHEIKEYSMLLCDKVHDIEILDYYQLSERYTRQTIKDKTVLWIGKQFHLQMLMMPDEGIPYPKSKKEGVLMKNGVMENVRLYDE